MAEKMRVNPTWAASIERQLGEAREALRRVEPARVAERAGARLYRASGSERGAGAERGDGAPASERVGEPAGAKPLGPSLDSTSGETRLELSFWGRAYTVAWPDVTARDSEGGSCPLPVESALLQYLLLADGTPVENEWVSLRNLPHGAFYEQAFQGYSGVPLAKAFRRDLPGFRAAAERLGGEPIETGTAAYRFWAFPRVPIAVVFWSGGDEFPDSAQVLFDSTAGHYQPVEMLAHLGGMLCDRLIAVKTNN